MPDAGSDGNEVSDVQTLIEQLGDSRPIVRSRAENQLLRRGVEVFEALDRAQENPDIEIASRAKYLLRSIRVPWVEPGDPNPVATLMRPYGRLGGADRLSVAGQLLLLSGDQGLAALSRIIRYDTSAIVSKRVAIGIIWRDMMGAKELERGVLAQRAEKLKKLLASSSRPGARWIAAYANFQISPRESLPAWRKLLDKEVRTLEQFPNQSDRETVTQFLFAYAKACHGQGMEAESSSAADQAFRMAPSDPAWHYQMAYQFRRTGLFDWSIREFRYAIDTSGETSPLGFQASVVLSEMFNDQGRSLEAGDTLKDLIAKLEKKPGRMRLLNTAGLGNLRAQRTRMHYFLAKHELEDNNNEKAAREHLDKAISIDPTDADVLFELYKMSANDPPLRKKTVALVHKAAKQLIFTISNSEEDYQARNHFAWLISNTEGDFDKAIKYSQESLKLLPNTSSFLDTLAHCYYAKKEYAKAVETQRRALELEPHSGLIARQYKVFQHALAQSQQTEKEPRREPQNEAKPKPQNSVK